MPRSRAISTRSPDIISSMAVRSKLGIPVLGAVVLVIVVSDVVETVDVDVALVVDDDAEMETGDVTVDDAVLVLLDAVFKGGHTTRTG